VPASSRKSPSVGRCFANLTGSAIGPFEIALSHDRVKPPLARDAGEIVTAAIFESQT
jgi:hypothetical protein